MSIIANADSGYPSKRGAISVNAGTLAEILRDAGYGTFAIGKWHIAPSDQISAVGPYDQWPLGRGFERYYGFLDAVTDQFEPDARAGQPERAARRARPERATRSTRTSSTTRSRS